MRVLLFIFMRVLHLSFEVKLGQIVDKILFIH
jgi:hypothetical protein